MYVGSAGIDQDPIVTGVADAVAPSAVKRPMADVGTPSSPRWHLAGAHAALIVGPPGFGKSSVLAAAADLIARRTEARVLPISGSVVASEGHLARLLARGVRGLDPHGAGRERSTDRNQDTSWSLDTTCAALAASATPILLAVDDLDALVFKREWVTERLVDLVTSPTVRLIASCLPAAAERFLAPDRPFATALGARGGRITSVALVALEDEQARLLVRRRAPRLSAAATATVIAAAGGHPAALVFLSRLAELRSATAAGHTNGNPASPRDVTRLGKLFDRAAEFAGAVYAEPWAALGPQQRAVLWQLSAMPGPTTAAEVATAIELPPSHVSAQLTRLVADGLVRRTGVRGQFVVAPLLASWIARRAARAQSGGVVRREYDPWGDASTVPITARNETPLEPDVDATDGLAATAARTGGMAAAERTSARLRRGGPQADPRPVGKVPTHNGRAAADGASMTSRGAAGRRRPTNPTSPRGAVAPATRGTLKRPRRAEES